MAGLENMVLELERYDRECGEARAENQRMRYHLDHMHQQESFLKHREAELAKQLEQAEQSLKNLQLENSSLKEQNNRLSLELEKKVVKLTLLEERERKVV